jgi:membrane-associated phospholipid phosphatase
MLNKFSAFALYICIFPLYAEFVSSDIHPEKRMIQNENTVAFEMRLKSAMRSTLEQPYYNIAQEENGDLVSVASAAGSFTKGFQHCNITSILCPQGLENFRKLLRGLQTGKTADFNAANLAPGAIRVLVNPQCGYAFGSCGLDSSSTKMPPPPNLSSPLAAADLIECYINVLCRDVLFNEYGTGTGSDDDGFGHSLTGKLAAVLNDLGQNYQGPRNPVLKAVDASVLFKGNSKGDLVGPYLSQFLLQPLYTLFPAGCAPFIAGVIGVNELSQDVLAHQQHYPIAGKREFGVSWVDFIGLQNGVILKGYKLTDYDPQHVRHIINGRDIGSYLHYDSPVGPYNDIINILTYRGAPLCALNPYAKGLFKNQGAGITFGPPEAFCMVGEVVHLALKAAWAHKWRGALRLRPEAMAGLVHYAKKTDTNPYSLHSSIFSLHVGVDLLELVRAHNLLQATAQIDPDLLLTPEEADTYLLTQQYPEGSPEHPSYPSGHATIAGAAITVIKAIFDDSTVISTLFAPVVVNPQDPTTLIEYTGADKNVLTVGGELDKFASNVALGRDFCGVHYRSDGIEGIRLGEQVAIAYLQDRASLYHEEGFGGFKFTTYDGIRIQITPDEIIEL